MDNGWKLDSDQVESVDDEGGGHPAGGEIAEVKSKRKQNKAAR